MQIDRLLPLFIVISYTLQNGDGAVFDPQFEQKLDSFVQKTMDCRYVPGLTLAVLKGNETWTKGYGYADLESSTVVTPDTLFNIGSVTKSFTMALLGNLLTERNMTWTAKVRDIMGTEYEFVDEYRTAEMTLKDLLSHRTGLARLDQGLLAGFPDDVTRENLVKSMRYLPESDPFRDKFLYNNFMFTYLGHICEVLGGDTWENLVRNRLLTPLRMTSTKIMVTPADVQTNDVAKPYIFRDGRYQNGSYNLYTIHPQEPAGAILSTGKDMIKWMQFFLNKGKTTDGTVLVDEKLMKSAMKVTSAYSHSRLEYFTIPKWPVGMTSIGYGYALFVSTYRGYERIWHSGGLFSYITRMFLYPDLNTGVFVSTSGPSFRGYGSMATRTVEYFASDGALGLDPWLNETTTCTYPAPWAPDDDKNQTSLNTRNLDNIASYTGYFNHTMLPGINISLIANDKTKLNWVMNRMSGVLHSTEEDDKFKMEILEPWELMTEYLNANNVTEKSDVTFMREDGHVVSLVAKYEVNITYRKVSQNYTGGGSINGPSACLLAIIVTAIMMAGLY